MTQNTDVPSEDELSGILDDLAQIQISFFERLDEILGENTLLAAADRTLDDKLTADVLNEDTGGCSRIQNSFHVRFFAPRKSQQFFSS